MTIKEVIARENVIITLDDGTEMDSEKTPEELLFILSKGNTIKDLDHDELTKAFVDGCEKDMMKAFVQNYDTKVVIGTKKHSKNDWVKQKTILSEEFLMERKCGKH